MENNFLKEFLKTGLFEIGDSDDRLSKLRSSIDDLQKILEGDYSLLPKYTLVALDPNISDTEPILKDVEEIVTKYWETLRSKYTEMPRSILRGVILNALNNIGLGNATAARIIFLTAQNFYPYAKLNQEKNIIESLLISIGDLAEENAIEEWSFNEESPAIKLGTLKITNLNLGQVGEFDKEQLKAQLRSASKNPNGHNPYQYPDQWADYFSQSATEGIATAFSSALKNFNSSLSPESIETPINKFFAEFKKDLDKSLKNTFTSLISVERRSKLLWWKETLYSQSQRKSYRKFEPNLLPLIMSYDLNNQLPKISPISVDFLLRDTLFLLNEKKEKQLSFSDYLKAISEDSLKSIIKPLFSEMAEDEGRITITDFISLLVNDRATLKDFQIRTGISLDEKTSISDLSVITLHDLLVQRLIEE
jgi:hypothetical protein